MTTTNSVWEFATNSRGERFTVGDRVRHRKNGAGSVWEFGHVESIDQDGRAHLSYGEQRLRANIDQAESFEDLEPAPFYKITTTAIPFLSSANVEELRKAMAKKNAELNKVSGELETLRLAIEKHYEEHGRFKLNDKVLSYGVKAYVHKITVTDAGNILVLLHRETKDGRKSAFRSGWEREENLTMLAPAAREDRP